MRYLTSILIVLLLSGSILPGCLGTLGELTVPAAEKDRQMGRETSQLVEEYIGFSDTQAAASYIDSIGQRLVRAMPDRKFDYTFRIVDMPESNAFAAPGGYVYVSRGLLTVVNSEDELANIISHEIIHVNQRHTAKKLSKEEWAGLLTLPGRAVGIISRDIGDLVNSPVENLNTALLAGYSRGNEAESDRLGQKVSAAAGYDPHALVPVLQRLEDEDRLRTGSTQTTSFFDTHPATPQRVREATAHAANLAWAPRPGIARDHSDFLARFDGLLVGNNPAHGVFQEQKFLHANLDFFIEFPAGWKAINTPMFVGAIAPQKDGILFLGLQGKGDNAEEAALDLTLHLKNEMGIEPTRSEPVKIGNLDAYLVTLTDPTGKNPVHMYLLWIAKDGLIYQLIGMAPDHHMEALKQAAMTFGSLTPEQRASILETRLRIVAAREGEKLSQLSKRTRNRWNLRATALMNGMNDDQVLKEGQLIKIAVAERY